MSKFGATLITLLFVAALAACGDEEADDTAAQRTSAATPAPKSGIPAELAGTWETTLKLSELENPPDDLTEASSEWTLKILGTGGTDNGPSMFMTNHAIGEIVNPVTVSGDQITLQVPVDCQVYSYAVDADQLTLTSAESTCPSDTVSSILTARPWQQADAAG